MVDESKFASMTDDKLFEQLQDAAIQEHEASERIDTDDTWISKQHHWADILGAIHKEIARRGPGMQPRYLSLLNANHPSIRLTAALAARKFAPDLAIPVLEDLDDAAKYGGSIAMDAGTTLDAMRERGEIPRK